MAKYDIFISYSRHDFDIVVKWRDKLESDGFKVWLDIDGVESGDAFKRNIVKAIELSSVVLFFSSEYSNASSWTVKEIGVAIYEHKPIIPILLDDTKYDDEIKFDLINLDYIDARKGLINELNYGRLVKALKSKCINGTKSEALIENLSNNPLSLFEPDDGNIDNVSESLHEDFSTSSDSESSGSIPSADTVNHKRLTLPKSSFNNKTLSRKQKILYVLFLCIFLILSHIVSDKLFNRSPANQNAERLFPQEYYNDKTAEDLFNTAEVYFKEGEYDKSKFAYALELYKAAADSGHIISQYKIGYIYHMIDEYQDKTKAVLWYSKASENRNVDAIKTLAYWYTRDDCGVPRDYKKAVKLYKQAAELGDGESASSLYDMYMYGIGVTENHKLGLSWLIKADSLGYGNASERLGEIYLKGKFDVKKDTIKALRYYSRASGAGDANATIFLASCYRNGNCMRINTEKAVELYNVAIDQNSYEAAIELGEMYYYGVGVRQDKEEAFELFKGIIRNNHYYFYKQARHLIIGSYALYYKKGINNRKKDLKLAYELYKIGACDFNSSLYFYDIGEFLENGWGVEKNIDEAILWYKKAAEQKDKRAIDRLKELNIEVND